MTKEETIKLMATINAFYAGGKNDPRAQANAWHLILKDFDYNTAFEAVINFAKHDRREYATFPAVGSIVAEIEKLTAERMKPVNEVMVNIQYGTPWHLLTPEARLLIDEELYIELLKKKPEEFFSVADDLRETLVRKSNNFGEYLIAGEA